jgi:hypothetical protein
MVTIVTFYFREQKYILGKVRKNAYKIGGTPGSPENPFPPVGKFSSLPVSVTTNNFRKPT